MKAIYVQKGDILDFINTTSKLIEAGDVVTLGSKTGVAGSDIQPGEVGSLHTTGVFKLAKKASEAIAAGTDVFFADSGVTATGASGAKAMGYAVAAAAAADETVTVKLA